MISSDEKVKRIRKTLKERVEPDRIPLHDFFWEEFLNRWIIEMGLPKDTNIYEYYDMDMMVVSPNWETFIRPYKILEKSDDYIIYENGFGATIKKLKKISTYQYLDFKYKKLDDLEKAVYDDPDDDRRFNTSLNTIVNGEIVEISSFKESILSLKDKFCIFGSVCEGHEAIWRIHGSKETFMDLAADAERMKREVNRIGEFMIEIGKRQLSLIPIPI